MGATKNNKLTKNQHNVNYEIDILTELHSYRNRYSYIIKSFIEKKKKKKKKKKSLLQIITLSTTI